MKCSADQEAAEQPVRASHWPALVTWPRLHVRYIATCSLFFIVVELLSCCHRKVDALVLIQMKQRVCEKGVESDNS